MASLARPGLLSSWPHLPGKRRLEEPGKPGQGQGFEVSLAIEEWLLISGHTKKLGSFSWPSQPENQNPGKPRIPGHVLQVTAIGTRNNFFYNISTYLLLLVIVDTTSCPCSVYCRSIVFLLFV